MKSLILAAIIATSASAAPVGSIFRNGFDPPIPPGCPATITVVDGTTRTLLRSGRVTYGPIGVRARVADLTTWDGIWGHGSPTDPVTAWPGVGGAAPVIRAFPKNAYVCAKFTTFPVMTTANSGSFTNPSYVNGPNLTMAITKTPAAIMQGLPSPGAIQRDVPTSDANLVSWKGGYNAPASWANLEPSTTYYVVLYVTNPASVTGTTTLVGPVSYRSN